MARVFVLLFARWTSSWLAPIANQSIGRHPVLRACRDRQRESSDRRHAASMNIALPEGAYVTPLPAVLATGLGALGLLGWRRKRMARYP